MKSVIGIFVLGAVIGGIFLLNGYVRTADGQSLLHVAHPMQILVETAQPEQREIVRTVQAPGEVEALEEVDISSEVVAKIVEMAVAEGQIVATGQLLCRLDDADYRARVRSGEAGVAKLAAIIVQAEAEVAKAELDYGEELRLLEKGSTSENTVAQYRTVLIGARARLEMRKHELVEAEAALQSAREYLAKTVIRAPIAGIVSQLFAEQGEVVITGTMNNPGTRIMVISNLSQMQVRCRVDEADAALVKANQPASIFLQSDTRRSVPGHVLRVGTKGTRPLGRDVVTFETLILIDQIDEHVKPGMTANVDIEVARNDDALIIPVQAVVYRKRGDLPRELLEAHDQQASATASHHQRAEYLRLAFVVNDDLAFPRLVQTGISDLTGVEILSGITATDTVVIGPYRSLDQLQHGSPVTFAPKPPQPPPAQEAAPEDEPTASPDDHPAEPPDDSPPATAAARDTHKNHTDTDE
jgi:HlyD family secretion protein